MTDDEREALIEEAAKAILLASHGEDYGDWEGPLERELYVKRAIAALAVFEQSLIPADDEMEAAQAYADATYPESKLAPENEGFAEIAEAAFIAGARFRRPVQGEPTWDGSVPDDDYGPWGGTEARPQVEPTDAQVVKRVAERAAQATYEKGQQS